MDSEEIIRLLSTSIYNKRFQFVHYLSFTDEMVEENERMMREELATVDFDLNSVEEEGRGKLLKASGAKKEADLKGLIKRWISRF